MEWILRRNQVAGRRTGKTGSPATFLLKYRTPSVQQACYGVAREFSAYLLLRHDEETDMSGYRLLILLAAILITGCEALVFVGATALN